MPAVFSKFCSCFLLIVCIIHAQLVYVDVLLLHRLSCYINKLDPHLFYHDTACPFPVCFYLLDR